MLGPKIMGELRVGGRCGLLFNKLREEGGGG